MIGTKLSSLLEEMQSEAVGSGSAFSEVKRKADENRDYLISGYVESEFERTLASIKEERLIQGENLKDLQVELAAHWGEAIEVLDVLISRADLLIMDVLEEYQGSNEDAPDPKMEALIPIGARAVRTARGAAYAIRGGFPDVGVRSWRTLHELGTIALLIANADGLIASRYIASRDINRALEANAFVNTPRAREHLPAELAHIERLKANANAVIGRYGPELRNDYGWASPIFNDNPRPKFRDLEEKAGTVAARWRYRVASREVHAGFVEPWEDFGLHGASSRHLLAGPSMLGLHFPGIIIGEGLLVVAHAVQIASNNLDREAHIVLMRRLYNLVCDKFEAARERLEGK